jgi:leader peptidase (prepilin peptidase)/N-methyltransferase
MTAVLIAVLAATGLAIGPVLRWLIITLAVPSGEPWRRACPACASPLPPVRAARAPALGPRGRCSSCRARIGPPPLSVEVTAAVLLGLLAARVHPGLVLAAACWLAVCAIPLACIDAAARRLPDVLTAPAWAGLVALLLIAAAVGRHAGGHAGGHWPDLCRALLGGLGYAAFCLILFLVSPAGMGPGDIKLAASLGVALAWLSWTALVAGVLAGFLLGACYGAALLIAGRASRKTQLPFGPFMIVGTFLVLLATGLR